MTWVQKLLEYQEIFVYVAILLAKDWVTLSSVIVLTRSDFLHRFCLSLHLKTTFIRRCNDNILSREVGWKTTIRHNMIWSHHQSNCFPFFLSYILAALKAAEEKADVPLRPRETSKLPPFLVLVSPSVKLGNLLSTKMGARNPSLKEAEQKKNLCSKTSSPVYRWKDC